MRAGVVVLMVIVAGLAFGWWHSRMAPPAQAEQTLLGLGSPLPGATPAAVAKSTPSCDNAPRCFSASRIWTTNGTITLGEFAEQVQGWASTRGLDAGRVEWDCGPNFGPFGDTVPGGACQLGLLTHDSGTPVFVWVTFRDHHAVAAAFAKSHASGAPINTVVDPIGQLGPSPLASIGLQVVTTS